MHDGTRIAFGERSFRIDFAAHTGHVVTVYGQTEVTRDLYDARERTGGPIEFEVEDVRLEGIDTDAPRVRYVVDGESRRIDCDFVAGCDGFHGREPARHPRGGARRVREALPLRLARYPLRDAARRSRARLRELRPRLRAVLDAQREPQSPLPPVRVGGPPRALERRGLLGRAAPARPAGHRGTARDGAVDREVRRAAPELRLRTDGGTDGCSSAGDAAHIVPADRGEGAERRRLRRPLPARGARRVLRQRSDGGHRRLLGAGARAGLEGRAVLVVVLLADAPLSRASGVRREDADGRSSSSSRSTTRHRRRWRRTMSDSRTDPARAASADGGAPDAAGLDVERRRRPAPLRRPRGSPPASAPGARCSATRTSSAAGGAPDRLRSPVPRPDHRRGVGHALGRRRDPPVASARC